MFQICSGMYVYKSTDVHGCTGVRGNLNDTTERRSGRRDGGQKRRRNKKLATMVQFIPGLAPDATLVVESIAFEPRG